MEFLTRDLDQLFTDRGIDASAYDEVVDFRDPITKYKNIEGYIRNISFLRSSFDPEFTLHAAWLSDERGSKRDIEEANAVTTRWTMTMSLQMIEETPLFKQFKPSIVFTGLSTYVFNVDGRISVHIDRWDSIDNQEYFSVEGFVDFLSQLLRNKHDRPSFAVLKRLKEIEIRKNGDGLLVAVKCFNGKAEKAEEEKKLIKICRQQGLQLAPSGKFEFFSDPRSIPDILKRNELSIALDEQSFTKTWPGPSWPL